MTARLPNDGAPNATALSDEDLSGLLPKFIATRTDLNLAEQNNIESATLWAFGSRRIITADEMLTSTFSDQIHRRMFSDVWQWAGQHRTSLKNIGVDPFQISTQMHLLFEDAKYWHEHSIYPSDELAVRLHHRLVSVHPYVNGNGRHSRLMADLYLHAIGEARLTWGQNRKFETGDEVRRAYIAGLKAADGGNINPLLDFARS